MLRAGHFLALIFAFCGASTGTAEARSHSAASAGRGKHASSERGGRGDRGRSHKRLSRRKRPEAPPPMPSRLEVLAIEPQTGSIRVELLGPSRPPETRLFVLSDDRGRRFVPATAECTSSEAIANTPPLASAKNPPPAQADSGETSTQIHWQCRLTVAPLYRRAALTGVSMEWGDRSVSALPGQVRARWAEGPTAQPTPPPASEKNQPETGPPGTPKPENSDPSTTPPSGADDEESDEE